MAAKLPKELTLRDLTVFVKHETEGKTLDQTAAEMGVSRDTIKSTKKRGSYRDLVLSAMEEKKFGVEDYVTKLIKLTDAEKTINCGGHNMEVPDQTTRMKAVEKIGKIYGDDAPTNIDISGSLAGSRDEDLAEQLEAAIEESVGSGAGEQSAGTSDAGPEPGGVL